MSDGDRDAADELLPIVYDELHRVAEGYMERQRRGHTLQPTALVNEALLRLVEGDDVAWESRGHFVAVAARAMRFALVDHARRRSAEKRGGESQKVPLDDAVAWFEEQTIDVLGLDDALGKLGELDEELARIVELRFFAGLTTDEVARALESSRPTIERRWRVARAWLQRYLGGEPAGEG